VRSTAFYGDGKIPVPAASYASPSREEDFPTLNAVFDEIFKTPFPTRTTVGASSRRVAHRG